MKLISQSKSNNTAIDVKSTLMCTKLTNKIRPHLNDKITTTKKTLKREYVDIIYLNKKYSFY